MSNQIQIIYDVETKEKVLIDIDQIIKGRALFQANSGGGKSYLLRKFLEESHGKVQQIVIDPEGEFHTLREKYDYLLVGKEDADIQIDTRHAELLAKRLMETGANAILDLYEMNTFERIRFVKLFCEALVNLPKKLWHPCIVIIDEIHVFAPESSKGRSESLEAVASLASRGRKRGYALVGATQKLSKFHKDVAAELNTKFTGRCTLDIDQIRAARELGFKDHTKLRELEHEFYVFGPGIEQKGITLVKSYPVKTTHEDIGSTTKITIANPGKIKSMLKNFDELPQEAENELRTQSDLKKKINEQIFEIRKLKQQQPKQNPQAIEKAYSDGYSKGLKHAELQFQSVIKQLQSTIRSFKPIFTRIMNVGTELSKMGELIPDLQKLLEPTKIEFKPIVISPVIKSTSPTATVPFTNSTSETITVSTEEIKLGRCETTCLTALAQRGKPSSKVQIATLAGYSYKSGGFNNAISRIKSCGYINNHGNELEITQEGLNFIGDYTPIPEDHDSILQAWISKLGKCPAEILKVLCGIYYNPDNSATKEWVAQETHYSVNSGGFNNSISKLNSLGLIEKTGSNLKASKEMFPDALV